MTSRETMEEQKIVTLQFFNDTFFPAFEQVAPRFHFALDPESYVDGPAQIIVMIMAENR